MSRFGWSAWWCCLVVAAAGHAAPVTVTAGELRLTLSETVASPLSSIRDEHLGRELLAEQAAARLFQLDVAPAAGGQRFGLGSVDARAVRLSAADGGARAEFADLGGRGVQVMVTVTPSADRQHLVWGLSAQLPADLRLELVRFPMVTLRLPFAAGHDQSALCGATKGGLFRRLAEFRPGQGISYHQPGNLAAQFGCVYDDQGGFYTACHDAQGFPKSITVTRTAAGVETQWLHSCYQSGRFALGFPVVWSAFRAADPAQPTDWRDAADRYKAWATQQVWCRQRLADRTDLPAWLKSGPAMVRFHRNHLARPKFIESWFNDYWRTRIGRGVPLVVAYWGWEKVATWITPDYFPAFPSDEVFGGLVKLARTFDGHSFCWPSGYHYTTTFDKQPDGSFAWDDRARFDREARVHVVIGREGKPHIGPRSWLQGGENATLCPGDPWTVEWFNHTADELARRGVELVQVDQVVGGGYPACYSTQHGHPPGPGRWQTEVFHRQLQTMLARCQRYEREAVVCFEEPNELFNHEVGLQDYRDWEALSNPRAEPASVFNYLYHEYLPCFQSNPHGGDRVFVAHQVVDGQMPHLVASMRQEPGPSLANGGFEDWQQTVPSGWDKVAGWQGRLYDGACAADREVRHGGAASLRLTNTGENQAVQVSQNVMVGGGLTVGRRYRLSAWIRSTDLQRANRLGLAMLTHNLKATWSAGLEVPREAGQWVQRQAEWTVPPGSDLLRIMLHVEGRGTVWVDDVRLEEALPDGRWQEVQRPAEPADQAVMAQWVALYHGAGQAFLQHGRLLHPPRLESATIDYRDRRLPAVQHNAFAAADGRRAVVLANGTDQPQTVRLHWPAAPQSLQLAPGEIRLVR